MALEQEKYKNNSFETQNEVKYDQERVFFLKIISSVDCALKLVWVVSPIHSTSAEWPFWLHTQSDASSSAWLFFTAMH